MITFVEFVDGHLPALSRFAAVLCGDRWLAEDVLQEVLARAQTRWGSLQSLDKPEAYVRRMIVNEFLSWRRKAKRHVLAAEPPDRPDGVDAAAQAVERDALVRELSRLPRQQRAVIVLRYYGGLSDTEIAGELGCSTGTVRSHASRALAALRIDMRPSREFVEER